MNLPQWIFFPIQKSDPNLEDINHIKTVNIGLARLNFLHFCSFLDLWGSYCNYVKGKLKENRIFMAKISTEIQFIQKYILQNSLERRLIKVSRQFFNLFLPESRVKFQEIRVFSTDFSNILCGILFATLIQLTCSGSVCEARDLN